MPRTTRPSHALTPILASRAARLHLCFAREVGTSASVISAAQGTMPQMTRLSHAQSLSQASRVATLGQISSTPPLRPRRCRHMTTRLRPCQQTQMPMRVGICLSGLRFRRTRFALGAIPRGAMAISAAQGFQQRTTWTSHAPLPTPTIMTVRFRTRSALEVQTSASAINVVQGTTPLKARLTHAPLLSQVSLVATSTSTLRCRRCLRMWILIPRHETAQPSQREFWTQNLISVQIARVGRVRNFVAMASETEDEKRGYLPQRISQPGWECRDAIAATM